MPVCQRWFPSNNFGADDMTSGEFLMTVELL